MRCGIHSHVFLKLHHNVAQCLNYIPQKCGIVGSEGSYKSLSYIAWGLGIRLVETQTLVSFNWIYRTQ